MIYAISKEINIYKTIEKLFDLNVIDLVKKKNVQRFQRCANAYLMTHSFELRWRVMLA